MFDLLLQGGKLVDGTGCPWVRADVGIRDGRVAEVGQLRGQAAKRTIDVDGLMVCPGFIDIHSHADIQLLADPAWEVKLRQGVTLDVIGQDGLGVAPVDDRTSPMIRNLLKGWNGDPYGVDWEWRSVGDFLMQFDRKVAPNIATLIPHGTVRLMVMGMDDRAPTQGELDLMRATVVRSMDEGAVGLSTGLTYVPAMYATDDELVALCRPLRPYGGYYAPHHRTYGRDALAGFAACIEIGRRAEVPVQLTHAHLSYGVNDGLAPDLLAMVDTARDEGVDVTLDSYPYLAGCTYLHAFLPGWAQSGGTEAITERIGNPDVRERIRREIEELGSDGNQGVPIDWSSVVLTSADTVEGRRYVGHSIPDAAAMQGAGRNSFDFYCDFIILERFGAGALAFVGDEDNVRTIMQHRAHMAGSDGIVVGDQPHPRAWGTFARFIGRYARDLKLLSIEEMVRKMTSLPAQRLGLFNRGCLRPGAAADVVCFDADRVIDRATYEVPRQYAAGVELVLVNGVVTIEGDHHTGSLAGRALGGPRLGDPARGARTVLAARRPRVTQRGG